MKKNKTLQLVVIANLSAISTLLYITLKFPWPYASFLDIQFSNLPAIIAGFSLGPVSGIAVVLLRTLLKVAIVGSSTAYVGEFADILIGSSVVFVSSVIYLRLRTKKGALLGSLAGILTWVSIAVAANYLFLVDFYVQFYFNGDATPLIAMMSNIPGINEENWMRMFIIYAAIPMNLVLAILVYGITFVVYKRLAHFINALNEKYFPKDYVSPTIVSETSTLNEARENV